jgi:hypothetical protein
MRERRDRIRGPFAFEEDTILRGAVTVEATVLEDVTLELRGVIFGDLIVEAGANVFIYGTVDGAVRNHGGKVVVYGTVGKIDDEDPDVRTVIVPTAVITSTDETRGRLH